MINTETHFCDMGWCVLRYQYFKNKWKLFLMILWKQEGHLINTWSWNLHILARWMNPGLPYILGAIFASHDFEISLGVFELCLPLWPVPPIIIVPKDRSHQSNILPTQDCSICCSNCNFCLTRGRDLTRYSKWCTLS